MIIKASIIIDNNTLISEILGDQFKMEIMVTQRSKEAPKTSEGIPVSFPVTIQETQNNMNYRVSMDSTMKLKKTLIHQRQIPGHQ